MRLARRALFAALATLILVSAVSAQTPRPGNDFRDQAPTVGTGGTPGGPTGLFTIYDGDTLRKGEFIFSIAYSNYERRPRVAHEDDSLRGVSGENLTDWIGTPSETRVANLLTRSEETKSLIAPTTATVHGAEPNPSCTFFRSQKQGLMGTAFRTVMDQSGGTA